MTDLTQFKPGVTRVVTPGGIRGTVERVSPKLRASVLVRRDDGSVKAYAPTELIRLAVEAPKGIYP